MSASAQTYTLLYSFPSADGFPKWPMGPLIRDNAGNLYGATLLGGNLNCSQGVGCGSLFRLSPNGRLATFHTFSGADGFNPDGGLILGAGVVYGTADAGGDPSCNCGTVFEVDSTGHFNVIHAFTGNPDADTPTHDLFRDHSGNLYGSTTLGGSANMGAIFEIDSQGHESVIENFIGSNGANPFSTLIEDPAGNLLGTTGYGGTFDYGIVFELAPSNGEWTETVLYDFGTSSQTDGVTPVSALVRSTDGNYYGVTANGGGYYTEQCQFGCGTMFKLTPGPSGWTETVLHAFTGGSDGAQPQGLARDTSGNLYGITAYGGSQGCGCGVVFMYSASGAFSVLHTFAGEDGAVPAAGPLLDPNTRTLYGTTTAGGAFSGGTAFKISF